MNGNAILGLLGVEVPPSAVGSAVPELNKDEPSANQLGLVERVGCPCPPPVGDPDLIDELLEAAADRELFQEE